MHNVFIPFMFTFSWKPYFILLKNRRDVLLVGSRCCFFIYIALCLTCFSSSCYGISIAANSCFIQTTKMNVCNMETKSEFSTDSFLCSVSQQQSSCPVQQNSGCNDNVIASSLADKKVSKDGSFYFSFQPQ